MSDTVSPLNGLAESFTNVIHRVDETIGENRSYGAGIGPHDEDDQIDALVTEVQSQNIFDGSIYTAKSDHSGVKYPGGRSADLVIETADKTVYCEAKLLRFQKANGNPSSQGFSKVFNPFQDRNPRSFLHDVIKLADSDIRATKAFLGIYYRPVNGAGMEITSKEIAEKFAAEVDKWTDHTINIGTIARFSGLRHDVHQRGAVITWRLADQPVQYF
jgi:hypothetical protein